jgi:ABC-type polysaccharide/polyol phosphate transport system ATPase subunit
VSPGTDAILEVEGVWRKYRRWERRPTSLKDAFVRIFQRNGLIFEDFWALKDVTFSLRRGEVLGICGGNGSGKSTLLKVLAHILPMTYGHITARGKIATLLDLGTGFLPELTGRENIALSGAIMGLTSAEVASHMDSIIEFADLGSFINSPIKTYSAGMYMRLGFAIAIHVDADILLIDEILAVGDEEFHRKCIPELHRMQRNGTSMVIASHALGMLSELCDRVMWLSSGRVMMDGAPAEVLERYSPHLVIANEG